MYLAYTDNSFIFKDLCLVLRHLRGRSSKCTCEERLWHPEETSVASKQFLLALIWFDLVHTVYLYIYIYIFFKAVVTIMCNFFQVIENTFFCYANIYIYIYIYIYINIYIYATFLDLKQVFVSCHYHVLFVYLVPVVFKVNTGNIQYFWIFLDIQIIQDPLYTEVLTTMFFHDYSYQKYGLFFSFVDS